MRQTLIEIDEAYNAQDPDKVKTKLKEGKTLVDKRMKLIRVSQIGETTVGRFLRCYMFDNLGKLLRIKSSTVITKSVR